MLSPFFVFILPSSVPSCLEGMGVVGKGAGGKGVMLRVAAGIGSLKSMRRLLPHAKTLVCVSEDLLY